MMDFDEIVVKESPGLCRCCLSEGCYKDLGSEYSWMSETEVYADMLLECFDISISQHPTGPNGSNRLICEVCITRLRDACNFKKQVLESEKRFVDMVGRGEFRPKVLLYQTQMKSELNMDIEEETGADEPEVEYLEDDGDYVDEELLKNEDYGEPSVSEDITVSALTVKGKRGRPKKSSTAVKPEKKAKVPKLEEKKSKAVAKDKHKTIALDRHKLSLVRRNIHILLQYGNVIPFMWSRFHTYICFYCKAFAMDAEALRDHVAETHQFIDLDAILNDRIAQPYDCEIPVKLDVKDISCRLCETTIDDINDLINHLNNIHQAGYDTSIKDCFLTFELDKEKHKCSTCGLQFNYFEYLLRHALKDHVEQNYNCSRCKKSFHKKLALVAHVNDYHKKGGYPCEICGSIFISASRRYHHKKSVHMTEQRACPECGKICKSKYYLGRHLETVHGAEECNYKCRYCGRKFALKSNMTVHVRRVHDQEKNVACGVCGEEFFNSCRLENHMVKHMSEEVCTCDLCGRSYQRKKALLSHMRTNHRDVIKS